MLTSFVGTIFFAMRCIERIAAVKGVRSDWFPYPFRPDWFPVPFCSDWSPFRSVLIDFWFHSVLTVFRSVPFSRCKCWRSSRRSGYLST